jgi:hypothetical protein
MQTLQGQGEVSIYEDMRRTDPFGYLGLKKE